MKVAKNEIKAEKSHNPLNKNKDRNTLKAGNSKCRKEVAMSYNETTNQLEQNFYNKASGCSVRAQEDNLFDYKFGVNY